MLAAQFRDELEAENAKLKTKLDKLLAACQFGNQADLPDFLEWLANRLVEVYGEPEYVDFVLSCRARAMLLREAIRNAS